MCIFLVDLLWLAAFSFVLEVIYVPECSKSIGAVRCGLYVQRLGLHVLHEPSELLECVGDLFFMLKYG